MTDKNKERWVNWSISAATTLTAVVLAFTLSSSEGKSIRIEEELESKAPIEYVDKQDASIQKSLDDYKEDHQYQHSAEMKSVDDKLQLIMDFWDIEE